MSPASPHLATVAGPPDVAAALAEDPAAGDFLNMRPCCARTGETRRRRIAEAVAAPREGRA